MNTTIKLFWIQDVKSALHFITADVSDSRHIAGILKQPGTHVFNQENLNDMATYFKEVNITVCKNGAGKLELVWADGTVDNVVSAIRMAIEEENIHV